MIFGQRKCSGVYRVHIGSPEGVLGTPGKDMGLMGQYRDIPAPCGLVRPHIGRNRRRRKGGKGEGKGRIRPPPFLLSPLSSLPPPTLMEGGRPTCRRRPSRITPTWGAPCCPSPSPTYIYVGGGTARTYNIDS